MNNYFYKLYFNKKNDDKNITKNYLINFILFITISNTNKYPKK